MTLDSIAIRIEQVLVTMISTTASSSPRLDAVFDVLRTSGDAGTRAAAEQRIWTIWCAHEDTDAASAMRNAIIALESGDLATAGAALDTMVERWPDWAEAWNKRATLRFVQGNDGGSLDDILRTLALEPRHFGAISGFGQICLRAGDIGSALTAFEHVLRINPYLESIRNAVETLRRQDPRTIH